MGPAQKGGGAALTLGGPVGQTDGGPQLHHGLVERPRGIHGDDLGQGRRHLLFHGGGGDVPLVPSDAGGDPQHVAVHRRHGQAKGDGGDGPGGVVPHPGQGVDVLVGAGERPAEVVHDLPGGLLQVPGPAVIAQPLPQLHQPVLGQGGQSRRVGSGIEKAAVVVQHRRHPGLLQHDLGHPHPIGGGGAAPGQHPGVVPIPQQQGDGQLFQLRQNGGPPVSGNFPVIIRREPPAVNGRAA